MYASRANALSQRSTKTRFSAIQQRCFSLFSKNKNDFQKNNLQPTLNNTLQRRHGRSKSGKQIAEDAANLERAKEQEEMEDEEEIQVFHEPEPMTTKFSVVDYTESDIKSFFDRDSFEIRERLDALANRNQRFGDVYDKLRAPAYDSIPKGPSKSIIYEKGQEAYLEAFKEHLESNKEPGKAKHYFEKQMGLEDEETREQIESKLVGKGARKLENEPKFNTKAMQSLYNPSDEQYKNYIKRNNLTAYDEYSYYDYEIPLSKSAEEFAATTFKNYNGSAETAPKQAAPVDKPMREAVEEYKLAQQYVAQKYVDKPREEYLSLFAKEAPHMFTSNDFAKMFIISNEDYKHYFSGGLGGEIDKVFDSVCQRALMIRPPIMPAINELKKVKHSTLNPNEAAADKKRGFVFTGIRGSGKSCALATVVHHAFKQNFLVFYIPSAHHWTHGIHYVEPSPLLPGYFDVPLAEKEFLKNFQTANDEILKRMKLSKAYDLPLEAGQKQPVTLYDLITYGLSLDTNIPVVFKLLLDELLANKEVPMLFAVDDINFLNDKTAFSFGNLDQIDTVKPKVIHGSEFVLSRYINRVIHDNKPNHIVVGANSMKWPMHTKINLEQSPLDVVQVPRYSYTEMRNISEYYNSAYWVFSKPDEFLQDLIFMSGAIPGLVWKEMSLV